jgi:hypothetical protein
VALAAATYLATFHRSAAGLREWQPLPTLLLATLAAALTGRAALPAGRGAGWPATLATVLLPLLVISWLIGHRLGGSPAFFTVLLVGLAVFGFVAWLGIAEGSGADATPRQPVLRADLGLVTSLLVLGGAVVAFRELRGYGIGLLTLAGFVLIAVIPRSANAVGEAALAGQRLLKGAVTLGLLATLYRVYVESNEYGKGFQPEFEYYYVALVLGALVPQLLAGGAGWTRGAAADGGPWPRLLATGLRGAVAVLAPLAVWLLVGERPQAGFLVGLAVGVALLLGSAGRTTVDAASAREGRLRNLLALAMACSAMQFTSLLQPLALRTRGDRIAILAALAVAAVAWAAVALWLDPRGRRKATS